MPWFPQFLVSHDLEPTAAQDSWQTVPFYKGILDLNPEVLLASWADEPSLDDPRVGHVSTRSDFAAYVQGTREWLALGDVTVHPLSTLSSATRSVEEVVVELTVGGERQSLPVAVLAEWDAEHRLTSIRVYHSPWPLFANAQVHPPVIDRIGGVALPEIVQRNLGARATSDLDTLLETYEEDAVVQTSTGGPQHFSGREEIRRLHSVPTIPGSRPVVELCSSTDDGRTCAVEYRVSHFGEPDPDQYGIAVYSRGAGGRISAERTYLVSCPTAPSGGHAAGHAGSQNPELARGGTRRARLALVPRADASLGAADGR